MSLSQSEFTHVEPHQNDVDQHPHLPSDHVLECESDNDHASEVSLPISQCSDESSLLRNAFHQAQTRARHHEEKLHFVYQHVEREVKSAVKEVREAKRELKKLRVQLSPSVTASAHEAGIMQRSVSDGAQMMSQSIGLGSYRSLPHSTGSPHPYLAALATPTLSPRLDDSKPSAASASMPPLSLEPQARKSNVSSEVSSASSSAQPTHNPSASQAIDGSYCLLPYSSDMEGPHSPHMHHSASHQAMLEAQAAMEELQRQSPPQSPIQSSSLHNSPVGDDSTSTDAYPASAMLPALNTSSSSNSIAGQANSSPASSTRSAVMETSSYHVTPTSTSPPIHPGNIRRRTAPTEGAATSSLAKSVTLSSMLQQQQQQQQPQQPSVSPSHSSLLGRSLLSSSTAASYSMISHPSQMHTSPSLGGVPASSSSPLQSSEFAAALRHLKESQVKFEALAQFCAPILLRSQSFQKLQMEAQLQQLGIIDAPAPNNANEHSDEELSASTELQMEALAAQQARAVASGAATADGTATGTPSSSPEDESKATSPPVQLVAMDDDYSSAHSSLVMVPTPQPTPEQERAAMELYIKKIKAEMIEEEEATKADVTQEQKQAESSAPSSSSTSSPARPLTFEEAMQGCVLLHQQLLREKRKRDRTAGSTQELINQLQQQQESHAAEVAALRARYTEALLRSENMSHILKQLQIPVDEKGKLPQGYEAHDGNAASSSFWKLAGLGLAFGSLLFLSVISWKRLKAMYETLAYPSPTATSVANGMKDELLRKTAEAATQTAAAGAAVDSTAAAAASVGGAAAAPSSSGNFSTPPNYFSSTHSVGPLVFTHSWSNDAIGGETVHYINLSRFPRFLDFLSRISLQFVQMG